MKKFLALILALVMVFSLAGVAFADDAIFDGTANPGANEVWNTTNESSDNVTVKVTEASKIYYVVITWGDLNFEYSGGAVWDPTKHEYDHSESWAKNTASITVTNHSNASVDAKAIFGNGTKIATEVYGFTAKLTGADFTLETAEGTAYGEAPNNKWDVSVTGTPDDDYLADVAAGTAASVIPVGTITVTVTPTP